MSTFQRRSLVIFIIKGFRTIIFIFIVISTTFRPSSGVCRTLEHSRNFELRLLLNPQGSPVLIPLAKPGTSVKYSCIVTRLQSGLKLLFSSIWPIHRTISGATAPGLSGPGSDGNEGVLRILQSSSVTRTSSSDCLVSYTGHSLGEVLPLCREAVSDFYSPSRLVIQSIFNFIFQTISIQCYIVM